MIWTIYTKDSPGVSAYDADDEFWSTQWTPGRLFPCDACGKLIDYGYAGGTYEESLFVCPQHIYWEGLDLLQRLHTLETSVEKMNAQGIPITPASLAQFVSDPEVTGFPLTEEDAEEWLSQQVGK